MAPGQTVSRMSFWLWKDAPLPGEGASILRQMRPAGATTTVDGECSPTIGVFMETGHDGNLDEEGWPTTQRLSRRQGEAFRGADYAAAIEVPIGPSARDITIAIVMPIGALLLGTV